MDAIGIQGSSELWPALWQASGGQKRCVPNPQDSPHSAVPPPNILFLPIHHKQRLRVAHQLPVLARAQRLAIAKGKDWSMQLHIFMTEKGGEREPSFQAQYPTGSLTYLKPLLGMTKMTKMRRFNDGRVVRMRPYS